jgi:5-hydroxyisourate hydrolase
VTDTAGISLSTHILDSSAGGGRVGVTVTVADGSGATVGSGRTDETGRIAPLAEGLTPGVYTIRWATGGAFVTEAAVTVHLASVRHYHVPLLASDHSATVYLGA